MNSKRVAPDIARAARWDSAPYLRSASDEFQLQLMLARSPGLFGLDVDSTLFYSSPDLNPVLGPVWMHCIVQG